MAQPSSIRRDSRWSLQGMSAVVTGGTKGIGYLSFLINQGNKFLVVFLICHLYGVIRHAVGETRGSHT